MAPHMAVGNHWLAMQGEPGDLLPLPKLIKAGDIRNSNAS